MHDPNLRRGRGVAVPAPTPPIAAPPSAPRQRRLPRHLETAPSTVPGSGGPWPHRTFPLPVVAAASLAFLIVYAQALTVGVLVQTQLRGVLVQGPPGLRCPRRCVGSVHAGLSWSTSSRPAPAKRCLSLSPGTPAPMAWHGAYRGAALPNVRVTRVRLQNLESFLGLLLENHDFG